MRGFAGSLLLLLIAIAFPHGSDCQDLIVTTRGDSLNCKIRGSDAHGIHYKYLHKGTIQRAYIPDKDVIVAQKKFHDGHFNGEHRLRDLRGQIFRLSVQGGLGWYPHPIDSDRPEWLQEHLRGLKIGGLQRLDVYFMPLKNWGFGTCLGYLHTRHTTHNVIYHLPDGSRITGVMQDDIQLRSYGASTFYQHELYYPRLHLLVNASIEKVRYRNRVLSPEPSEKMASGLGGRFGMGLEYRSRSGLGAGVSMHNAFIGRNSQRKRQVLSPETLISRRRWDLVMGLSFSY